MSNTTDPTQDSLKKQIEAKYAAIKVAGTMQALANKLIPEADFNTRERLCWAIGHWKKGVPVKWVIPVEEVTGVSRHLLRPDIYPEVISARYEDIEKLEAAMNKQQVAFSGISELHGQCIDMIGDLKDELGKHRKFMRAYYNWALFDDVDGERFHEMLIAAESVPPTEAPEIQDAPESPEAPL